MNPEFIELIRYRQSRAFETLEEANLLYSNHHFNSAVNRIYYACFYIVTALLLTENKSSAKHSGILSIFNQHWIKTEKIPLHFGRYYRALFESRQKSDYADFVTFNEEQVKVILDEAPTFIKTISDLIERNLDSIEKSNQ
jgi:uncharacterized protein